MLKLIGKVNIIILKLFLCFFWSLFLGVAAAPILVADRDWQIVLYLILFAFVLLGFWLFVFIKNTNFRIIYIIIIIIFVLSATTLPQVKYYYDWDTCMDSRDCFEGLTMENNKGEIVIITKENCIENGYIWTEKARSCNLNRVSDER